MEPSDVTGKRFGVREQKMRKQNRLRVLHVRHARHRHAEFCLGLCKQRIQQRHQSAFQLRDRIDDEQTEIGGDQFVAAAPGVQFPAKRAELLDQRFFDEMVDILGSRAERFEPRRIRFRALRNFVEGGERLFHFRRGENAHGLQSFGPGTVNRNLVRQETTVERKRALERVELFVWFALEASAPQPVVFAFGHFVLVGQAFLPVPVFVARQIPRTDKNVSPTYFLPPLLLGEQLQAAQTN